MGEPLGERRGRERGDRDDGDPFLTETLELTPDGVKLSGRRDEAGSSAGGRAESHRTTSSWVFAPRATAPSGSSSSRANPSCTRPATANTRSHLSSTYSAASSQARCWASNPTSGQA